MIVSASNSTGASRAIMAYLLVQRRQAARVRLRLTTALCVCGVHIRYAVVRALATDLLVGDGLHAFAVVVAIIVNRSAIAEISLVGKDGCGQQRCCCE